MTDLSLTVNGVAVPQGSKRAFVNKYTGRASVAEAGGQAHKDWRARVAFAAQEAMGSRPLIVGPVVVALRFYMPKPASAPKRRITWPKGADVDKLARCVLDSLTHTVIANDSQVVAAPISKHYGDPPRVEIDVTCVPEDVAVVRLFHVFGSAGCGCDQGWLEGADGVVPCPTCRPGPYAAWAAQRRVVAEVRE